MTSIGSISGVLNAPQSGGVTNDVARAASDAIGEIGGRVLAWVQAVSGQSAGNPAPDGFAPDLRQLARGGDVYGLGDLGHELAARFDATPAQEGDLRRSLEGFTRAAVIQLAGLAGASGDRQTAGISEAVARASDLEAGSGLDGVVQRVDAATAVLRAQNGD